MGEKGCEKISEKNLCVNQPLRMKWSFFELSIFSFFLIHFFSNKLPLHTACKYICLSSMCYVQVWFM